MLQFAWTVRLPSYVYASRALRRALVPGVASALLMGPGNSANAAPRGAFFSPYGWYGYFSYPADVRSRRQRVAPRRERAEPNKEVGFGEMPKGPLQIVVSIDHQRVTLFSNGVRVAQGPVSTGVPGHPTPMGVFSVIEKDRYHRSNLYSNAPMPFMQRITWSGVALHEGVLPGYPASHGCIRMSRDFAQKLWPTTQLGARVVIARGELAPVDFEHPKLFVPKPKPEPQVAGNATTTDGRDVAQIAVAPATTPGARDDATPARAATDERGNAERATPSSQPMKAAEDVKVAASIGSAEASDPTPKVMAAEESWRPAAAAAPLAPADPGDTSAQPRSNSPATPAEVTPITGEPRPPEVAPAGSDGIKPAPTIDPVKPNAPRLRSADQPAKRSGQVAVFVSRKEKKIFVRQGFVPLFDVPVVIEEARSAARHPRPHCHGSDRQGDAMESHDHPDRPVGPRGATGKQEEAEGAVPTGRPVKISVDRSGSARSHSDAAGCGRPHQRTPDTGFVAVDLRRRARARNGPVHRVHRPLPIVAA